MSARRVGRPQIIPDSHYEDIARRYEQLKSSGWVEHRHVVGTIMAEFGLTRYQVTARIRRCAKRGQLHYSPAPTIGMSAKEMRVEIARMRRLSA